MHRDALPLVHISGEIDSEYLAAALRRAKRTPRAGEITINELTEGRQSNKVYSLRSKTAGNFVLKTFPLPNWRDAIFGKGNGEIALWRSGATRKLPAPLFCPTIDVAHHRERNEEWMLMEDVSRGIMPRGVYDEKKLKWLLRALAALHAQYWDDNVALAKLPLISLETHVRYFAEPICAIGGRTEARGWVKDAIKNITVLGPMIPHFLEALGRDADFYLDLSEHRDAWLSILARSPLTLVHGDIRRANVSPRAANHVSLFDWDMASRAPAASDLGWFWFLHFWCYPPKGVARISSHKALREYYVRQLAARIGKRFDKKDFDRSWDLAWHKAFVQLGFCLIDPLMGPHGADTVEEVRARLQSAISEARRIIDAYVG